MHNRVYVHPDDGRDFEALVRYMMRSPVSLCRLRFTPGGKQVVYTRKGGQDTAEPEEDERIDAEEFVARVLVQIPDPRRHLVRYYGAYSNRAGVSERPRRSSGPTARVRAHKSSSRHRRSGRLSGAAGRT